MKNINIEINLKEAELLFMMLAKCDPLNIYLGELKRKIATEIQTNYDSFAGKTV